jgi:hypothetical protein
MLHNKFFTTDATPTQRKCLPRCLWVSCTRLTPPPRLSPTVLVLATLHNTLQVAVLAHLPPAPEDAEGKAAIQVRAAAAVCAAYCCPRLATKTCD